MSWTCPDCKRTFRTTNQWHSCARLSIDHHFQGKSERLRQLFDLLLAKMKPWGAMEMIVVQTSIHLRTRANFLDISVKKNRLDLSFYLDHEVDAFPVVKSLRTSRNRVVHSVSIDSIEELDVVIMGWLKESYDLIKGNKPK